jgi:hypothetical protein
VFNRKGRNCDRDRRVARGRDTAVRAETRGDGGKMRLLYMPSGTNAFLPFVIQKLGLDRKYGFVTSGGQEGGLI